MSFGVNFSAITKVSTFFGFVACTASINQEFTLVPNNPLGRISILSIYLGNRAGGVRSFLIRTGAGDTLARLTATNNQTTIVKPRGPIIAPANTSVTILSNENLTAGGFVELGVECVLLPS